MNEEEKKAIEDLNDFKTICIMYGNTFTMFLEQLKKYQYATDTVLNLVTKLEKENTELKQAINVVEKEKKQWIEENNKKQISELIYLLKIKFDKDELKSPSFTKEQLDLMNLGINLYKHFNDIFNDIFNDED